MMTVAELEVIHETRPLTIKECQVVRCERFGFNGELYYKSQDHVSCLLMRKEFDRLNKRRV